MSLSRPVVSANSPGKVLLVGGYLVLENGSAGGVLSSTSTFQVTYEEARGAGESATSIPHALHLSVVSPQFHSQWQYVIHVNTKDGIVTLSAATAGRNVFVETAVRTALLAIAGHSGGRARLLQLADADAGFRITARLLADNDFYSQRDHLISAGTPVTAVALRLLPPHLPAPVGASGAAIVHKTGLGSSAALVTSLTAATLAYFGNLQRLVDVEAFHSITHTCAQIAHGIAQGKIGSGFDVCSAVYGSITYRRIPPRVMEVCMARVEAAISGSTAAGPHALEVAKELWSLGTGTTSMESEAGEAWTFTADAFVLPKCLSLLLADVAGGSETPGMVRKVLEWRAKHTSTEETARQVVDSLWHPSAGTGTDSEVDISEITAMLSAAGASSGPLAWRQLAAANARVAVIMQSIASLERKLIGNAAETEQYLGTIRVLSKYTCDRWLSLAASGDIPQSSLASALAKLATAFRVCRHLLRAVGEAADVPIEPAAQTSLADATLAVPGVAAAGVPGAGGFDALFALILAVPATSSGSSDVSVRETVEGMWASWPGGGLTPLLLTNGPGRGEEGAGTRIFDHTTTATMAATTTAE